MKQFPIIINTEQDDYPITLTYHNFPNVDLVDPDSIGRSISSLKNILEYYKVNEVNLLYTSNQIV